MVAVERGSSAPGPRPAAGRRARGRASSSRRGCSGWSRSRLLRATRPRSASCGSAWCGILPLPGPRVLERLDGLGDLVAERAPTRLGVPPRLAGGPDARLQRARHPGLGGQVVLDVHPQREIQDRSRVRSGCSETEIERALMPFAPDNPTVAVGPRVGGPVYGDGSGRRALCERPCPRSLPEINRSSVARRATVRVYRRRRAIPSFRGDNRRMREVRIAMLGSGFVAEFYMQGLANVNGQEVVANYSRSRRGAPAFARRLGDPRADHRPRGARSRATTSISSSSRCPTRRTSAGVAGAAARAAQPGLHQAAGTQSRRGPGDARGGREDRARCTATPRPRCSRPAWSRRGR